VNQIASRIGMHYWQQLTVFSSKLKKTICHYM